MSDRFNAADADRLLSGGGSGDVARALSGLRVLAVPVDPAQAQAVVAKMAAAAAAGTGLVGTIAGTLGAHKAVTAVVAAAAIASGGAATGTLPAPVQRAVANTVEHVGIDLPGGRDAAASSTVPVARSATTTSTTTTTSSTSTSTTTTTTTTTTTVPSTTTTRAPVVVVTNPPPHCAPTLITASSAVRAAADLTSLTLTATTSGPVDTVVVDKIPGTDASVSLTRNGNSWTGHVTMSDDAVWTGKPIRFMASGCGATHGTAVTLTTG